MRTTLRVLIVEDSLDDAELVLRELRRAGYDPVSERVETAETMKAALERAVWDLVISDYAMPEFDAPGALKVLKQSGRDLPFIVVSGTIGEEVAVGMMTAGAHDYLLKGNLTRLVPAIERELREVAERRKRRLAEQGWGRLATAVGQAAESIMITDSAGTIQYVNPAFERITGFTSAEAIGQNPRLLKSEQQDPATFRWLWQTITAGQVWSGQLTNRRKDGTSYEEAGTISPVRDDQGRIAHFISVREDVTAQKRALVALAKSEQKYRTLFESSRDAIMTLAAPDWKFAVGNAAAVRLFRATNEVEFISCSFWDLSPQKQPDGQASATKGREVIEQAVREGSHFFEWTHRRFDGEEFPADVLLTRMEQEGKVMLQAYIRDATERQRAQAALLESEDRYRSLVEESPDMIGIYQDDKLVFINSTGVRQLRARSKQELLERNNKEFIYPDDLPAAVDRLRRRMAGESGVYPAEVRYRRLDGTILPAEVIATPVALGGKEAVQFIARDITERKHAEQHLRDSAALYHSLVENLSQYVFRKDQAGHYTFGNDLFCQSLGKPLAEILGKTDHDFFPAPLAAKYQQDDQRVLQTGQTFEGDEEHRHVSGRAIIVHTVKTPLRDAAGQIIGVQGIAWDITEKRQLEAQLLRSQRLEAIGTLAGGVAHDLNNALAPIMMGLALIKMRYPEESQIVDMFETSAKRGAAMVRHLMGFAKGVEGERVSVQPASLVNEMANLMKGSFPKNLELVIKCDSNLPLVRGDATQLHQILLNLCVNARDAMSHGGTLTLEAESQEVDAVYASCAPDAKPGKYVALRVRDTGTGIAPEILDRIFDPFFTTKGPDHGTGLGLSTVMGIVKGHGGFLQVLSQLGHGSTFTAYLPATDAGSDPELVPRAASEFRGERETILFVDDEPGVREMARTVLRHLNFTPLTATDGADGLMQAAQHRAELRAVITDVHMPRMDGLAFVRALRGLLPDIPVIVISGRLEDAVAEEFKQVGVTRRLDKPFSQIQLAEVLNAVMIRPMLTTTPP